MNTVEFLDAVKKRHGLASDYAVAKFFKWRISRVYEYKNTPRELDDEACVQVAAALDLPPPYVMACIAAARAKDASIKKHWLAAARLLKTGTAAVILATVGALAQVAAPAPAAAEARLSGQAIHYASWRRRRSEGVIRRRRRRKPRTVIVATANGPGLGNTLAG